MKLKILILHTLLLTSFITFSQELRRQIELSSSIDRTMHVKLNGGIGFSNGIEFTLKSKRNEARRFGIGAYFSQFNYKTDKFYQSNTPLSDTSGIIFWRTSFFEAPLTYHYLMLEEEKFKIHFEAGISFNTYILNTRRSTYYNMKTNQELYTEPKEPISALYYHWLLGFSAGFEFEYVRNEKLSFVFNPTVRFLNTIEYDSNEAYGAYGITFGLKRNF